VTAARVAVELYVYYKLARRDTARLRELAAQFPSVALFVKDGGDPELPTWMEIHRGPQAEADAQALGDALMGLIVGTRHVERFRPA